ncbi:hypothetical protein KR222_005762, partial [Zaprionus bogoriensis]
HSAMRLFILIIGFTGTLPTSVLSGSFKLTNVKCRSYDTSYCETKCQMRMIRRGVSAFDVKIELHQKPVNNVILNLQLFKKSNGYQPFLLNHSLDFCHYMRNPMAHIFFQSFHKTFSSSSNINHTCPYNHDICIENFVYDKDTMMEVPIPNGEYMLVIKSMTSGVWRSEFQIYIVRS